MPVVHMPYDVIDVALNHLPLLAVRHPAIVASRVHHIADELIVLDQIVSGDKIPKGIPEALLICRQDFRRCFRASASPAESCFRNLPLTFITDTIRTVAGHWRRTAGIFYVL